MKIYYATGVSKPAVFSSPNYTRKNTKIESLPDNRSTIFLNSNFFAADAATSTFTFYTSDIPATYNVTITGFTVHGDIIQKTITIKSK